jgi:hypothetical protein
MPARMPRKDLRRESRDKVPLSFSVQENNPPDLLPILTSHGHLTLAPHHPQQMLYQKPTLDKPATKHPIIQIALGNAHIIFIAIIKL